MNNMLRIFIIVLVILALVIALDIIFWNVFPSPSSVTSTTTPSSEQSSQQMPATQMPMAPATSTTSAPSAPTTPAAPQTAHITIQNFAFMPQALQIPVGTTVTWTNTDNAPHRISSATFSSQVLQKGDSYSNTFKAKGTFNYICSIHPYMTGTIVVQ